MMLAQSVLEYSSISSFTKSIGETAQSTLDSLAEVTPDTWYMVGAFVLLILLYIKKRSRRRL